MTTPGNAFAAALIKLIELAAADGSLTVNGRLYPYRALPTRHTTWANTQIQIPRHTKIGKQTPPHEDWLAPANIPQTTVRQAEFLAAFEGKFLENFPTPIGHRILGWYRKQKILVIAESSTHYARAYKALMRRGFAHQQISYVFHQDRLRGVHGNRWCILLADGYERSKAYDPRYLKVLRAEGVTITQAQFTQHHERILTLEHLKQAYSWLRRI